MRSSARAALPRSGRKAPRGAAPQGSSKYRGKTARSCSNPPRRFKKGTSNELTIHHTRLFRTLGRPDSCPHGHCRIERYDQNALPRQYAPSTAMRHCCWLATHPPRGNGRGNFVAIVSCWNARLRASQARMKSPRDRRETAASPSPPPPTRSARPRRAAIRPRQNCRAERSKCASNPNK